MAEPWLLYPHRVPAEVVREYLAEVANLVNDSDVFSVLADIDYPIRSRPEAKVGPFDPWVCEGGQIRHAQTPLDTRRARPGVVTELVARDVRRGSPATTGGQNPPVPFGVPRPVGPSQPTRAVHSCDGEQEPLLPEVMSKKLLECVYG